MSKHEEFMRRAIALSRRCMIDNGSAPFAALIVKGGVVVGEGVNNVVNHPDPSSHGEIEAIRDAARRLGRWDLSGRDLYTTCEPCELCGAAMFWAKIPAVLRKSLADYENIGFDLKPLTALVPPISAPSRQNTSCQTKRGLYWMNRGRCHPPASSSQRVTLRTRPLSVATMSRPGFPIVVPRQQRVN